MRIYNYGRYENLLTIIILLTDYHYLEIIKVDILYEYLYIKHE